MVVNVNMDSDEQQSDSDLLVWLNDTLQSGFIQVEHTCSGAAYCQLLDLLSPGCINLQNVKFSAENDTDILNNYKLLEDAFIKSSINKTLEIEKLVTGNFTETLNLLKWFRVFFGQKFSGQKYDPVVARGGQTLEPVVLKATKPIVQTPDAKSDTETLTSPFFSKPVQDFIHKFCPSHLARHGSSSADDSPKPALGYKYPKDISVVCNEIPYCLYMYQGIEVVEEKKSVVILIGYFDQTAGKDNIILLNVVHEPCDLFSCINNTLKTFEIPLQNLAAFYSNATDSTGLVAKLRALNSSTVFLSSFNNIVQQAYHSGLMAIEDSIFIQTLICDIRQHFAHFPIALKEQLHELGDTNSNACLTSDCLLFAKTLQKLAIAWPDLVQYFSSQNSNNKTSEISCLLREKALRLSILFLSHALKPLCEFQESLNHDIDARTLLLHASSLVRAYTSSYLSPKAVEHCLRRGNYPPKDMINHLPREEVKVGKQVMEYLQQTDLEHVELFYKCAVAFYSAVTLSIIKNLPLPESALANMAALVTPEGKMAVTGKAVADLAIHLGFSSGEDDFSFLVDEFLEYQCSKQDDSVSVQDVKSQSPDQYWKMELRIMGRRSILKKLILKLLALPKALRMDRVFAQVFESVEDCTDSNQEDAKMEISQDKTVAQSKELTESSSCKNAPSHSSTPEAQENLCVVDLTEEDDAVPMETSVSPSGSKMKVDETEPILIDDDDDVVWTNTSYAKAGEFFMPGNLVWGKMEGFGLWPGQVQDRIKQERSAHMVKWFGYDTVSMVYTDSLRPFGTFAQSFCHNSFATKHSYKDAIFLSLQMAAKRVKKVFSHVPDCKEELLRVMLDWAFSGFKVQEAGKRISESDEFPQIVEITSEKSEKMHVEETQEDQDKFKLFNLKKVSVCIEKLSDLLDLQYPLDLRDEDVTQKLSYRLEEPSPVRTARKSLAESRAAAKRHKYFYKNKHQKSQNSKYQKETSSTIREKKIYSRSVMVHDVLVNGKNIEGYCLSCGSTQTEVLHPLFEGSLCLDCKNNFKETLYRYDDDGYQSYCTVCCAGQKVILCGNNSCCRSFCVDCVDILIGENTFDQLKDLDPWICYLCAPESSSNALRPRHDWSIRVQEFFANDSAMEFEPHRVYPSIPASQRRPIRVLSLFDGIGTGFLVLKDLGIKVEKYIASEIDDQSIAVSTVNHDGRIIQVDGVRQITKKNIENWGPFDLLIGGSPCNDLSMVNPARKGLFEGTGRLFFDYYRMLNILRPKDDDPRPFFWLFENVVFMANKDKTDICRFLECNPVLVDAVKVSPAHRARYFWGNLPGMNRPITASQTDKLTLQECLEVGRIATYDKVRTITTNSNSLKQGSKKHIFPVTMNGKEDGLWITELEKIFGFPKHYTDVKNMGRSQRQKVLAKSWSVPVIRHLLAPLKDYFACD